MKLVNLLSVTFALILASACSNNENNKTSTVDVQPKSLETLGDEQLKIDAERSPNWSVGSSLSYQKNEGEDTEAYNVKIYLNDSNEIEKYAVQFREKGKSGNREIYCMKGKSVSFHEIFEESTNPEKAYMVERIGRISNGKVTECIERTAELEIELPGSSFKKVDGIDLDEAKMQRCLDQKEEFQTTFLSFLNSNGDLFMFVGEPIPGKNAFSSAIFIGGNDPFIQELQANPKKYEFRKISIAFESFMLTENLEAQRYVSGKFL